MAREIRRRSRTAVPARREVARRRDGSRRGSDLHEALGANELGLRFQGTSVEIAAVVRLVEALLGPINIAQSYPSRDGDGRERLAYGQVGETVTTALVAAAGRAPMTAGRRGSAHEALAGAVVEIRLWGTRAVNQSAAALLREVADVRTVSRFCRNRGGDGTIGRVFVKLVVDGGGVERSVVKAQAVRLDRLGIPAADVNQLDR